MAFTVFRDHQQGAAFVLCIVTMPLCTLVTLLRLVATKKSKRPVSLDDIFALLALGFFLAFAGMFLYLIIQMNGRSMKELQSAPPGERVHILKVGWAMSPQYCGDQLFTKLSLFVLYHRLFSVNRTFVRWLYGLVSLQVGWFISKYITSYLLCVPVKKTWNPALDGSCIKIGPFVAATEAINSMLDFAMIVLALWIVTSLQIHRATKWRLAILFSLGGLAGIIGFIKIGEAYSAAYSNILSPLWNIVQMAASIICCCAPIYQSLVPRAGAYRALKWVFGSQGRSATRSSNDYRNVDQGRCSWPPDKSRNGQWMRIHGSQRDIILTNVTAAPNQNHSYAAHPTKRVEVRQSYEYV